MLFNKFKKNNGFTLIETLVGVAVFLIVATAAYQAYTNLFILTSMSQFKILALNLANEQFEISKNLSYADIGEINGIPNGTIPPVQTLVRGGVTFTVTTTVRNIDLPFDGTLGGNPGDSSPADNKLVEVKVECETCKNYTPIVLTTNIAPKNLEETGSANGSLLVKVFDANGIPVSGANVHIVNNSANPQIDINDVTDINGNLSIIDAPPGVNAYAMTVSKPGYSTASTYPPGEVSNPNPTEPHSTVVTGQVTQVSFSIDRLGSVSLSSVTPTCVAIGNFDFNLKGSKMIGENVYKYTQNLSTNGSGQYSDNSMEWDTYTVSGSLDSSYEVAGVSPLNPVILNPNGDQDVDIIVVPKNPQSLLVTVKDGSTGLPISNATVSVTNTSGYSAVKVTDRGYVSQSDWSSGSPQETFVDEKMYFDDNTNIDINNPAGELKMKYNYPGYGGIGELVSSTFDTGSASNFSNIIWSPVDQPEAVGPDSVKLQIATNSTITATTTWEYRGPDGATTTYYTIPNSPIHENHNGDRYLRYRIELKTASSTYTPNISDISFTYTSSCIPPGQVLFSGLTNGTTTINVDKSGYSNFEEDINISTPWYERIINMSP